MSIEYDEYTTLAVGTAQAGSGDDKDETEYPVAVLWMPASDSRHGWCDRWVMRKKENKPPRQAGFKR